MCLYSTHNINIPTNWHPTPLIAVDDGGGGNVYFQKGWSNTRVKLQFFWWAQSPKSFVGNKKGRRLCWFWRALASHFRDQPFCIIICRHARNRHQKTTFTLWETDLKPWCNEMVYIQLKKQDGERSMENVLVEKKQKIKAQFGFPPTHPLPSSFFGWW